VLLLAFISYQSSVVLQRQQAADIEREAKQLQRIEHNQGVRALVIAVERLSRQPGPGIYYLGDETGRMLVGNATDVPVNIIQDPGTYSFNYDRERPSDEAATGEDAPPPKGYALVRSFVSESGLRVVVGRDVVERRGFTAIIVQWFFVGVAGILLLSIIAGLITARRVLKRIDAISATSTNIMAGNLSERVPVTSRNDEFDGLATNLNAMLDRIEQLMQGLKEVTDNVAHDLKTPLTRMRNRAESALLESSDPAARTAALETTISESDKLIRTFNALLMIARAEAGAPRAPLPMSISAPSSATLPSSMSRSSRMKAWCFPPLSPKASASGQPRTARTGPGQPRRNAMKYFEGEPGTGKISVGVRQQDGRILIEVADNGPGIPVEDRKRVLERFVRLEQSRTEPGSGLGLSLVAAVARLHKGEFRIEDNEPGVKAVMDLPAV
jgi:signal transduction histidine kinase